MISTEKRAHLVGIHLREVYRLVLGGMPEETRDDLHEHAHEAAVDLMVKAGLRDPEQKDRLGVPVGDTVQTLLMAAILLDPSITRLDENESND